MYCLNIDRDNDSRSCLHIKSHELSYWQQAQQNTVQTAHRHTPQTGDTRADGPAAAQEGTQTSTRGGWDIAHRIFLFLFMLFIHMENKKTKIKKTALGRQDSWKIIISNTRQIKDEGVFPQEKGPFGK
jgi:hypothetical protein